MKRIMRYFREKRFDRDLKAEIEAHLDEKVDDFIETVSSLALHAPRRFGNSAIGRTSGKTLAVNGPMNRSMKCKLTTSRGCESE